jgi:hypothetical protein
MIKALRKWLSEKRYRIKYKIEYPEGRCVTICPFNKFERVASSDCVRKCKGFINNNSKRNVLKCNGKNTLNKK